MPLYHRIIVRGFLLTLGLYFFIHIARNLYELIRRPRHLSPFARRDPYDWEPSYSGWYNRSVIITDTTDIHLTVSDLILVSASSSWGDEFFNLAMFRPDLCITNHAALRMNQTDLIGIESLARELAEINQDTWNFYNLEPAIFDVSTESLWLYPHGSPRRHYDAYAFSQYGYSREGDRIPRQLCELLRLMRDGPEHLDSGDEDLERLLAEVSAMRQQRK
jgi:hypothetical protein